MCAFTITCASFVVLLGVVLAQDGGIQRGVIQKLDLDGKSITLSVGKEDRTFDLLDSTLVVGSAGKTLAEKLQGFKVGAEVMFKPGKKDGKDILVGIKLADDKQPGKLVSPDTSKLVPLTELGTDTYQGFEGGLYRGGKNQRPKEHEAAGLALAREVVARDADGRPSPDGKIVLLSVGMSNTTQVSQAFAKELAKEKAKNPNLVFVDGAQGGMTAAIIQNAEAGRGKDYWSVVDDRLKKAGVSRSQVQAVWIKEADAGPKEGFPAYARKLKDELGNIVRLLHDRFANVKLVYLSSRTYAGFATTALNPEPYAYESGFAVKWLVEQQLSGDMALNFDAKRGAVKAPWLSWGPYLWANGTTKRKDGFYYEPADFANDGTHPSPAGQAKVGRLLLEFFKNDSTTRGWFLRD